MADRRALLVTQARDSIAKGSRSFALASRLFAPETRERAWLLYSWCRKCDDIADGQDHGGALTKVEDPAERLAFLREINKSTPKDKSIHISCENYATHKHLKLKGWLKYHKRLHVHFTHVLAAGTFNTDYHG